MKKINITPWKNAPDLEEIEQYERKVLAWVKGNKLTSSLLQQYQIQDQEIIDNIPLFKWYLREMEQLQDGMIPEIVRAESGLLVKQYRNSYLSHRQQAHFLLHLRLLPIRNVQELEGIINYPWKKLTEAEQQVAKQIINSHGNYFVSYKVENPQLNERLFFYDAHLYHYFISYYAQQEKKVLALNLEQLAQRIYLQRIDLRLLRDLIMRADVFILTSPEIAHLDYFPQYFQGFITPLMMELREYPQKRLILLSNVSKSVLMNEVYSYLCSTLINGWSSEEDKIQEMKRRTKRSYFFDLHLGLQDIEVI